VRVGDTLHFRQEITAKQEAKEPNTGIVTFGMEMINERGEVVSRGGRSALVVYQPKSQDESQPWHFVFGSAQDLAKK
jgi:acyl dehydratase